MMLGSRGRGEALMWLDGAIIALWAGTSWYSSAREQDARLIAAREAGADLSIADEDYYKSLERYDNVEEYYEDLRREARDRYPDDPEARREYLESRKYAASAEWNWSNDSARFDYWGVRRSARSAALTAGFAAGGLLLNRIVSVVDCIFFAGSSPAERRVEVGTGQGLASVEVRYRF